MHVRITLNNKTQLVEPNSLRSLLATKPRFLSYGATEYNTHYANGMTYEFQDADLENGRVSISTETIETEAGMHSRVLICTVENYNVRNTTEQGDEEHVLKQVQFKYAITDELFISQLMTAKARFQNTGEWRLDDNNYR